MNNIDWVIILLSVITLFLAVYIGIRIGEYKVRKSFIDSVYNRDIEVIDENDYDDDIYIDTSDPGPLN